MKSAFLCFLIFSINVFAEDFSLREKEFSSIEDCFKGVHFENEWMAYGNSFNSLVLKNNISGEKKELKFNYSISDFIFHQRKLFILSRNKVEIYSLDHETFEEGIELIVTQKTWHKSLFISGFNLYIASKKEGVKVFDLASKKEIQRIQPKGEPTSVFVFDDVGYIYAEAAGIYGGYILSAVYLFDPLTFEIFHQVHINGAPGNGLYVNKKDVFLGERFFWQVRKSKIHRKSYIGSYKSVYIPKPHNAKGRAFRDSKNLYFCSDVYSKPKVVLRSTIER